MLLPQPLSPLAATLLLALVPANPWCAQTLGTLKPLAPSNHWFTSTTPAQQPQHPLLLCTGSLFGRADVDAPVNQALCVCQHQALAGLQLGSLKHNTHSSHTPAGCSGLTPQACCWATSATYVGNPSRTTFHCQQHISNIVSLGQETASAQSTTQAPCRKDKGWT